MGAKTLNARVGAAIAAAAMALGAAALIGCGASAAKPAHAARCDPGNGGLTLSPGFCASVFADNLGNIRHLNVAPSGVVYVNSWSGRYYPGGKPSADGFLIALQDTHHSGHADVVKRFGDTVADGSRGGTGVQFWRGYVYAEENDKIVRYKLAPGQIVPTSKPETVLSGMPVVGDHPMHPFIIDAKGELFVDLGTATNACQPQTQNRKPGVPGLEPCVEKETRGGTWKYDATKLGQTFSAKARYISGLRNGEGLSFDAAGRMFATQHGRDQLLQNWPALYPDPVRATELPAEELVRIKAGADYGWPECYYDQFQKKLVLAPEYGGDGGHKVGVCATRTPPVAAFPGHWAPNDMTIYKAAAFPPAYQGGAFIAFHGSWNRAPAAQAGYNVVYQPLKDGRAAGPYVIFADGFSGPAKGPATAAYRPMGLAVAPDGALYISDDVKGRIWRVSYVGGAGAAPANAPTPHYAAAAAAPAATPASLPVPPGSSAAQVAHGGEIFHTGTCAGCHGPDAKGSPLGPDLTAGTWLWSDGSLAALHDTILQGVSAPKKYRSGMPPMGGQQLSPDDLNAVTAYVWAVGHQH